MNDQGSITKGSSCRIENSSMIQVISSMRSIWRGKVWFNTSLKIKVDQYFLRKAENTCPQFVLYPFLEDCLSKIHYGLDSGKVKFQFENCVPDKSAVGLVDKDPYNTLHVEIHQDLFKSGDKFRVVIDSLPYDGSNSSEIIFGCSQIISALLEIRTSAIKLRTQLVYDDGSSCPLMPLSPLKERRSIKLSSKPLYRRLQPDPTLYPQITQAEFSFRIEEVSFHHSGHNGFKLKVSTVDYIQNIHPGTLEETIVVLSKPRPSIPSTDPNFDPYYFCPKETMSNGPHDDISQYDVQNCKTRKVSDENANTSLMVSIPVNTVFQSFQRNQSCVLCGRLIRRENFLRCSHHEPNCKFVLNIYPLMSNTSLADRYDQGIGSKKKRTKHTSSRIKERKTMTNLCQKSTVFHSNIPLSPVNSGPVRVKAEGDSDPYSFDEDEFSQGDLTRTPVNEFPQVMNDTVSTLSPFLSHKRQSELNELEELEDIPMKIEPMGINDPIKWHQPRIWDESENRSLLDFLVQGV